jgi:hypothetical protein
MAPGAVEEAIQAAGGQPVEKRVDTGITPVTGDRAGKSLS